MSLARIETSALRSRRAVNSQNRVGPAGFHHNPQDFSEMAGSQYATRQTLLAKNWHYLPSRMRSKFERLSTSYKGVEIDDKGQMGLGLS